MHKDSRKRLGEGLREQYQLQSDLPEAMQALLEQLKRPSGQEDPLGKKAHGAKAKVCGAR